MTRNSATMARRELGERLEVLDVALTHNVIFIENPRKTTASLTFDTAPVGTLIIRRSYREQIVAVEIRVCITLVP
jgi:hypothetical protein